MVFLILLMIATAILLAWLLVAVSRQTLGDLHISWLHTSPAQPDRPAAAEASSEAPTLVVAPEAAPSVATPAPIRAPADEPVFDDGTDTEHGIDSERAVREHLSGRSIRDRRG